MPNKLAPIDACIFDAYGTLFDINAAAKRHAAALGEGWTEVSATWRRKQLEYSWLRSLMGDYADFWQVTREALLYALAAHGHEDNGLVEKLMTSYRTLESYPDATSTLAWMKHIGLKIIILSNGTQAMLADAIAASHLDRLVDGVLSVGAVGIYKPHPRVYQLAVDRLGIAKGRICFVSSNGWDAAGAAHYGFRTVWINRNDDPRERLPAAPEIEITALAELQPLIARS
jgi:2-haloacid dehalogenase